VGGRTEGIGLDQHGVKDVVLADREGLDLGVEVVIFLPEFGHGELPGLL
jgi:hypothetical protein